MVGFVFLTHGEIISGERGRSVNCLLYKHKDLSSIQHPCKKPDLGWRHDFGEVTCATSPTINLNSIPGTQMVKGKKRVPKGFFRICVHSINKCD